MEKPFLYTVPEIKGLHPQKFKLGGGLFGGIYKNISLFPVPQANALGTNDMNNAITLISFHHGRIGFYKYFKNSVDDIGGGGQYLPIISEDTIGLGQTRDFLIYDFKRNIHHQYKIVVSLAKTIQKVAIADARQRHFMFEIEKHNTNSHDPWDLTSTLQLMDLSGEEARLIKEKSIGKGVVWSVASEKNFLYDLETEQLQVLDMSLEPAQHPLADLIRINKEKLRFTWIHSHPYLPFAILSGGKYGSMIIVWGEGRDNTPNLLISSAHEFSFSPDGQWVSFKEGGVMDFARTYLMPVSEKYSHYVGTPILLVNDYFNSNKFGWTTNPVSFVGSSQDIIYRWELTNQAHPESDRATFHDYIVEHDLEKLTKEKRQGLGEKHKVEPPRIN